MRRLFPIIFLLLFSQVLIGQDKASSAFLKVIQAKQSTAPDYAVVTVKVLDTGRHKEIMVDVNTLYQACRIEIQQQDDNKVYEYLIKHADTRTFEFKKKEALKRLDFKRYKLKSVDKIENTIKKERLIDSLGRIIAQRELISEKFYEYSDQREDILSSMKDSILTKRTLTPEEEKMLSDLTDQYYDYHYNEYAEVSEQGRQLMTIWNRKISPHRQHYETYLDELARLEQKFYKQHLKKYGQSFCHLLFKYGVICYSNNEIGTIEFGEII